MEQSSVKTGDSKIINENNNNNIEEPEDYASLEYEEDCYYAFVQKSETPSFDLDDPSWTDENDCMFVIVEEDFEDTTNIELDDSCRVEAEFYDKKTGRNKFIKGVRVKFQDLSKPYLARITSPKNYYRFLQLVRGGVYLLL